MGKPLVSGEITFAERPDLPSGAKAYVRLLDTSEADALSSKVAEQVLTDIASRANRGEALPFALDGKIRNERASYTVSVLIDLDGDGEISAGDYINMQSYPVLTYGFPDHVSVEVKRIR
jgi:uncharacterized lipoprotein YbaY